MTRQLKQLTVSRETIERLETYESLLTKWNPKINLVSRKSLDDLWHRHIEDSAQLWALAPENTLKWIDIGSGGGFPGLVIAILAHELRPAMRVHLVESDQRKCAFLRTVAREVGVSCEVHAARIESLAPQGADIISARALSDLSDLLAFADRHLDPGGTCLFPKGLSWEKELEHARTAWSFTVQSDKSTTSDGSVVLQIREIAHV